MTTYNDTLRLVDIDSATTIDFDFNDGAGQNNPNSLKTKLIQWDPGTSVPERTFFEGEGVPILVDEDDGEVEATIVFDAEAATYEDLRSGLNELADMLRKDGAKQRRIVWNRDGAASTERRFFHIYTGDVYQPLGRGTGEDMRILRRPTSYASQVTVVVAREPFARSDEATVLSPTVIPNDPADTNGRAIAVTNSGDAPMPVKIKAVMDTGSAVVRQTVALYEGTATERADYLSDTMFLQCEASGRGWTVALSNNTASAADTAASGGNVAQCTYASNPTIMQKRIRATRTTKMSSLKGRTFDVYLRFKTTVDDSHTIRLLWGPSTADPPQYALPDVVHDPNGATSFGYVMLNLGRVHVPDSSLVAGMAFEVWSKSEDSSARANFDYLFLVPVGANLSRVEVPGGASESWLGSELVTPTSPVGLSAGTVSGTELHLDAVNEAGGAPPNAGSPWGVGRHRLRYTFDVIFVGSTGTSTVRFAVRNVTDNNDAAFQDHSASYSVGLPISSTDVTLDVEFTSVGGKSYQPQARMTAFATFRYEIKRIEHTFVPFIASGEGFFTDPVTGEVYKVDSSGNLSSTLEVAGGVPAVLPADTSLLILGWDDTKVASSYSELENVITRDPTVTATGAARWPV